VEQKHKAFASPLISPAMTQRKQVREIYRLLTQMLELHASIDNFIGTLAELLVCCARAKIADKFGV
jgi:hypothetical protein